MILAMWRGKRARGKRVNMVGCWATVALACVAPAQTQQKTGDKVGPPQPGATIRAEQRAPKTYAEMVKELRLEQKDADLRAAFPQTVTGAELARVATLVPFGLRQGDVPEARQMAEDLAALRKTPDAALAAMRSGFQKLPAKYWAERQFLIQIGGRLPVARAVVISFLTEEMSRPVKISAEAPRNLDYLSPATAADTLVFVVADAKERDMAFRQAAKAQTDRAMGQLVLSRYEAVDAERARALGSELELMK
jgi:hypothetical protein